MALDRDSQAKVEAKLAGEQFAQQMTMAQAVRALNLHQQRKARNVDYVRPISDRIATLYAAFRRC